MTPAQRTASRVIFSLSFFAAFIFLIPRRTTKQETPRWQLTLGTAPETNERPPLSELPNLIESLKREKESSPPCQSFSLFQLTQALGKYGPRAKAALPYLYADIANRKIGCYLMIDPLTSAIVAIDPSSPRLGKLLVDSLTEKEKSSPDPFEWERRDWLARSLSKIKIDREGLRQQLAAFVEANPQSVLIPVVAQGLHALGTPDQSVAPLLIARLEASDDVSRRVTCSAIARFPGPEWAVSPLQKILIAWPRGYSESYDACLELLFGVAPRCPLGTAILTKGLLAQEDFMRRSALRALWNLAVNQQVKLTSLLPLVVRSLVRPGNPFIRYEAANTLSGFGKDAIPYLPAAFRVVEMERTDESLIALTQSAIRQIDPDNADLLPLLVRRMKTGPLNIRERLTFELISWGSAASDAVPALLEQLHERNAPLGLLAYTSWAILAIDSSKRHLADVKRELAATKAGTAQAWEKAAYDQAVHQLDLREVEAHNE